jgi:acetyltransferase
MNPEPDDLEKIRAIFEPESVAIVGASRTPGKFGNTIVRNLIALGYEGAIFPVNPSADEICGLKSYPSLSQIPQSVDVVTVAVPASLVPDVIRDCERKGVKGVVIITSGFSEAGEEGMKRQQEMLTIARIVGPNTTGILNPYKNFTSSFVDLGQVRRGTVAFIAQTGMFAGTMLEWIVTTQNFGLSKVAGLGNKCDVDDHEVLAYLAQDEATKVIIMYIEGINDGKRFFQAAQQLAPQKPIIVLKGGRTREGAGAAMSHTGSLATSSEIFDALLRQTGAIRVDDMEEMVDLAKMFAFQPLPRGNRMGIVTISGGAGVMAADACIESGMVLAKLNPKTLEGCQQKMPSWARIGHPMDIEPLFETVGMDEAFRMALDAALSDEGVDCCQVNLGAMTMLRTEIDFLLEARQRYPEKPLSVSIIGRKDIYDQMYQDIERAGIPVYFSIRRAVNSMAALCRYRQFISG